MPTSMQEVRTTAQDSAKALLSTFRNIQEKSLAMEKDLDQTYFEQSFEMIERELAGYLSHPKSVFKEMFNGVRSVLFPAGLVFGRKHGIYPGHDLLLAINGISDKIKKLKNPEYGIRDIVGYELALKLFLLRGDLLKKLVEFNPVWEVNLQTNQKALSNLIQHPKPDPVKTKKASQEKIAEQKPRPLKISEITLARLGVLSFFYDRHPPHKNEKDANPQPHLTQNLS